MEMMMETVLDDLSRLRWRRMQELYAGSKVLLDDLPDSGSAALVVSWGATPEQDRHRVDRTWLKRASEEEFTTMVELEESARRSRIARSSR
jgi:hypothetical protein